MVNIVSGIPATILDGADRASDTISRALPIPGKTPQTRSLVTMAAGATATALGASTIGPAIVAFGAGDLALKGAANGMRKDSWLPERNASPDLGARSNSVISGVASDVRTLLTGKRPTTLAA